MTPFTDDELTRFWQKVEKTQTCWLWKGAKRFRNYGDAWANGRHYAAHRLAYEAMVRPIPIGMTIDHICRVTSCVNPSHLRVMTMIDNVMDGCVNAKKDHCPKGHPYDEANTLRYKTFRYCRSCKRVKDLKRWARIKDVRNAFRRDTWRKACGR